MNTTTKHPDDKLIEDLVAAALDDFRHLLLETAMSDLITRRQPQVLREPPTDEFRARYAALVAARQRVVELSASMEDTEFLAVLMETKFLGGA